MGLKAHTGQANPNPNIKAQENTLSASVKPLSPFKPRGTVKQSQHHKPKQSQYPKAKQTQTKELPNLNSSRRQFIEQYGAYALVTPVALYAMMSPNRAMAQAGSAGVVDDRPRVLNEQEKIETFDINTRTEGFIDGDGDLLLLRGQKYIASDGFIYTCTTAACYIVQKRDGTGVVGYASKFTVTYSLVDDSRRSRDLIEDETIDNFDITTHTDGYISHIGDLVLKQGEVYITQNRIVYLCVAEFCFITPQPNGKGLVYENPV